MIEIKREFLIANAKEIIEAKGIAAFLVLLIAVRGGR
jgi:hypothetical protein